MPNFAGIISNFNRKHMMNRKLTSRFTPPIYLTLFNLCILCLLLAACTQDELAEQGNTLPDGEYPLQIGSVSIIAESSEEPWTRVTEKPDGSGSVWQPDDAITVSLDGETATYTYDAAHGLPMLPSIGKTPRLPKSLPGIPLRMAHCTSTAKITAWCMCCGLRQTMQATTLLLTCSSSTNLPRYE